MVKIGLVGRICSGKDTAAHYLKEKGYFLLKFSDILKEILELLGIEVKRENLQVLGESLRSVFGNDVLSRALVKRASGWEKVVVNGIRSVGELNLLKSNGFVIIGVDSSEELRFERVNSRNRFNKKISMAEFRKIESHASESELNNLIKMSDFKIVNNSSLEELKLGLDEVLKKIKKS